MCEHTSVRFWVCRSHVGISGRLAHICVLLGVSHTSGSIWAYRRDRGISRRIAHIWAYLGVSHTSGRIWAYRTHLGVSRRIAHTWAYHTLLGVSGRIWDHCTSLQTFPGISDYSVSVGHHLTCAQSTSLLPLSTTFPAVRSDYQSDEWL